VTYLPYPYTLAAALLLAGVFIFGNRLRSRSHRRWWVSIAGGVSVATIFIDLLPEISERQAKFSAASTHGSVLFPEQAIYLAAMLGFMLFYGLEYLLISSPSAKAEPNGIVGSFRVTAFAGYSGLIAYLLVHSVWPGAPSLVLYALAMAFHLLLIDHSLAAGNDGSYMSHGRWFLALSVLLGWSAGMLTSIPEQWLARITGFVCGGVIMNTLVVELPEGRGGRFWAFVIAAAAYTIVLVVVLG
jgi:hypothetical protein